MTAPLRPSAHRARLAATPRDLEAAQALRHLCFRGTPGLDADRHDATSRHLLVEDAAGALAACLRLRIYPDPREVADSYAAQSYDLARLSAYPAPLAEMGRFCVRPAAPYAADALRVAWGALTALVDEAGVGMLFGCSSFPGTDPTPHAAAFAHLAQHHPAPAAWAPGRRAPEVVPLAGPAPEGLAGLRAMPPLLRAYLAMGGWTGDHAVIDRDLGTLHVLTAIEAARVPPARARALRLLAGHVDGAAPPA